MSPTDYSLLGNRVSLGLPFPRETGEAGSGEFDFVVEHGFQCSRNSMWRLALGIFLSILPRRWRNALRLNEAVPWEPATVLSGFVESLLALILLLYWYSRSVTTWAANALDSALRGGPESAVPGQAIGFSALVLWILHPLTWLIAYFILEGLVRLLAAAFTDQIFGTFPLAFIDWCYGKATRRPPEGDSLHSPGTRAQLQSVFSTLKEKIIVSRLPELEDELVESTRAGESFVEIHASRPKPEWVPPRVVRIGDAYFRLEQLSQGKSPRPFVFALRRLAAGVPGRSVILYQAPRTLN